MGSKANLFAGAGALSGGFASLGSAYSQAQAARLQGDYQKQQYDLNAQLADLQSKDALYQGDVMASNEEKKISATVGSQRAAYSASGVDVNSGSAAITQNESRQTGAIDVLTIKNNAWRTAMGYRMQAISATGQGNFAQLAGQATSTSTLLTGGIQAITGGLNAAYYGYGGSNPGKTGGKNASA